MLFDLPALLAAIHAGQRAASFESRVLEFKREKASPEETERDIAEAAICLGNGIGGTVVVGVSDRVAGPAALMGTALDPDR
ncbi:MAG: transcriptional regulator, partial [Anaerolinea sp.]|nr:transcriptional regulator [Anaerolinea sp.]